MNSLRDLVHRQRLLTDVFPVGNVLVDATDMDRAIARVLAAPTASARLSVHFCSANTIVEAEDDEEVARALRQSDIVAPDGMPLVWVGRLLGRRVSRVCGPDFMAELLRRSVPYGLSHYFYGGTPETCAALVDRVVQRYPGVNVAGFRSPPFRELTPAEEEDEVTRLTEAAPDYLWVGLGSPKQDLWTARYRAKVGCAAILAVGAAFDFLALQKPRAPVWMQRLGLEWLFRLVTEPKRLWKRYTITNARFIVLLLRQALAALVVRAR